MVLIIDDVVDICTELLKSEWLKSCSDEIEITTLISSCEMDYCMSPTNETKREVISQLMDECKEKIPDDEIGCSWPEESAMGNLTCGPNQHYVACGSNCNSKDCLDKDNCNEHFSDYGWQSPAF